MAERLLIWICDSVLEGSLSLEDAIALITRMQPANAFSGLFGGYAIFNEDFQELENRYNLFAQRQQPEPARLVAELGMAAARATHSSSLEAYFAYLLAGSLAAELRPGLDLKDFVRTAKRRAELCRTAVQVFEKDEGAKRYCALALMRLGIALGDLMEYEESVRCHRRSVSFLEAIGDMEGLARAQNNLGYALLKWQKLLSKDAPDILFVAKDGEEGPVTEAWLNEGGASQTPHKTEGSPLRDLAEARARVKSKDLRMKYEYSKTVVMPGDDTDPEALGKMRGLLRDAVDALERARELHAKLGNLEELGRTEVALSTAAKALASSSVRMRAE